MSVRQYIGARYVTKIYENSLDPSSAEWETNVNYEPLTMVTFNYGSYLSKKHVPASVGNPADNPAYWAQTGFYNGQISMLQNEINNIQSEIETHAIYIGNSYVEGIGSTSGTDGIYELTKDLFNTAVKSVESGNGFFTYTGHNTTFTDQLTEVANNMTPAERAKITHIFAVSAAGDCRAAKTGSPTLNWMLSGISPFLAVRDTYFPNAKVYITLAEGVETEASLVNDDTGFKWEYVIHDLFRSAADYLDFYYMGFIGWEITHMPGCFAFDGLHPNDNGYTKLSHAFKSAFNGTYHPTRKKDTVTTGLGGQATLYGYPDETVITFAEWDSAVNFSGNPDLLSFYSSSVIPAWIGNSASEMINAIAYEDQSDITSFSRLKLNTIMGETGYSIKASPEPDPISFASGKVHAIPGTFVIRHCW